MKSRFSTLVICKSKNCYEENKMWGWKLRTGPHVWTDNIDDAISFVAAGGGESLRTLVVGSEIQNMEHGHDFGYYFLKNCPKITSLSIVERGSSSWDKFGSQLQNLELRNGIRLDFPLCSTALLELTLYAYSG